MEKDAAYIYNEIFLSRETKDAASSVETWMGLEPVRQSEVSQRKTSIVLLVHVCGSDDRKCRAGVETQDV